MIDAAAAPAAPHRAGAVAKARDIEYWRSLVPELSIEATGAGRPPAADRVGPARAAAMVHSLASEGYFDAGSVLSLAPVAKVRAGIEQLLRAGWPPAFIFLYDDAWSLVRRPAVTSLLQAALGAGYWHLPDVWAMHVPPGSAARGFAPHPDATGYGAVDEDGSTNALTIWIALTDATLDNSCIYLIPGDVRAEPGYPFASADDGRFDPMALLHRARALPAAAGSVLGWNHNIIHWGAPGCARAVAPRVSLSFEFCRAGRALLSHPHLRPDRDCNAGLSGFPAAGPFPAFTDRLRLVAKQLTLYTPHARLATEVADLGCELIASLG